MIRAVGVETGGSNVQFAVNPATGEIVVIEMNPRVSRSSALASKATGFPIAKIAARLAVGYALEEITNDITRATPAALRADDRLRRGEDAALRLREVPRRRRRALHPHEVGGRGDGDRAHLRPGLRQGDAQPRARHRARAWRRAAAAARARCERPSSDRYDVVLEAFAPRRSSRRTLHARTAIDPWFLRELQALALDGDGTGAGVRTYKAVDTCAAEFAAADALLLLGLGAARRADGGRAAAEIRRGDRPSVVILGSGPNRIGQGIEFDYCCVHATMTVRESGRDAVMINCNPETVSTDYDTSDRLYFEPLTLEDVLAVCDVEQPEGVIVQFGGQTPLKLAAGLEDGRRAAARDRGRRDRPRRGPRPLRRPAARARLRTRRPTRRRARRREALAVAPQVGFPLLVRPSYVLGGRAMEIVYST